MEGLVDPSNVEDFECIRGMYERSVANMTLCGN